MAIDSAFHSIEVARSGLMVYRTWMDAVSYNIANINTVRPTSGPAFRARLIVAQSREDGGATADVTVSNGEGRITYEPSNPLADADGFVRYPDVDLAEQMVSLIAAQRGYQANLAVVERARDTYLQALKIGS